MRVLSTVSWLEPMLSTWILMPVAVAKFVEAVDDAKVKEARATAASNVNNYRETDVAYGSETSLKADKGAPALKVSADYLRK